MKKLLDSKFLFIVALSTIVLIFLGVLAFYLFDDSDASFIKSGYVLNPLSAKSEKYYFDKDTNYHENLSAMVVFNDTDKKQVSIFKESFVHYMDESLSFLKNGAILDIDSIKGKDAVKFYNITSKSIINKKDNGYVIDNNGNDIILKDFIGRISDNKYIVVGDIEAKIPGNEKNISGDYFEIVYTDEGIINIENKDVKFAVTAEGSYIYAGNVVIDLGNKKITKDGEDVMSLTAITINGDENIEIIPKAEEKKEEDNNEGNGNDNNNVDNSDNTSDNQGEGGNSEGGSGDKTEVVETEALTVSLEESEIGSTYVTVTFDVDNYRDDDMLSLRVTNLDTGRTVNKFENIHTDEEIRVNLLSPDTKYLFTVVNENDESKYFQKIFTTNGFGINFEKSYVTSNEIGYKVTIDEGSEITDARLTLKKYNEETNESEVVGSYQLKDMMPMTSGEHDGIIFSSLDSDTIYTAVLDNFSFATTMFNDIYNISLTSLTLKNAPTFGDMKKEINDDNFKIYLESVNDPDNAITNYSYYVYDNENPDRPAIDPIVKSNASAVTINIGDGVNELKTDTNYFYRVAIEYFDNEKYIEYVMDGQLNLYKGGTPYITISKNENEISYNQIGATIYLMDNSCLISMPGREKCDGASTLQIDIKKKNYGFGGTETSISGYPINNVQFDVDDNIIKKDIFVPNLEPGVTYVIYVSAVRNDLPDEGMQPIYEPDGPTMITTKTLASFDADWENEDSSLSHPISSKIKLNSINYVNSLSGDETADLIKKVVLRLYNGEFNDNLQSQKLIISKEFTNTDEFNIKEAFYDNEYNVTSDGTFGLTIDQLKILTGNDDGKLSEYYTLYVDAYYDINEMNPVNITNKQNSYYISKSLRADDIKDPIIDIIPITKKTDDLFDNSLTNGTTVGYTVTASIDRDGFLSNDMIPNKINFYVYDNNGNRVQFYINSNDTLTPVDKYTASLGNNGSYETKIYMGYGTDYNTVDNIMRRGNKYYIGYDVSYVDEDGSTGLYPSNMNPFVPTIFGLYSENVSIVKKDSPKINYLYPTMSTVDNKVTYIYEMTDIDNALYYTDNQYKLYYNVNESEQESEINITKVAGDIPTFRGTFTIDDLTNGDGYTIYEKINEIKTGNIEEDIVDKTIGYNNRLFDGYYDAKESKYNFKYQVINNPLLDNKVTIKILASDDILDRVLDYKVSFKDTLGHTLNKDIWFLNKCEDASDDDKNRCFNVEYTEIKSMKSDGDNINNITVDIDAIYDNGLMGMGYNGMVGEDKDYPYMILQENSTVGKIGKYYIINNRILMKHSSGYPYGYYTFELLSGNRINYISQYNTNNNGIYNIYLGTNGYELSTGTIIPKMLSVDKMNSDDNSFSFSSITPMIRINNSIPIINGAKINMALSGADVDDFCIDNSGNRCVTTGSGKKYLYLAVWDKENLVDSMNDIAIPLIKVELDNSNINNNYEAIVENLLHGSKYYYNVYAYLNNNGNKQLVQLFDASYKNKYVTYTFNSSQLSEIFDSYIVNVKNNLDGEYNDKLLETRINLNSYEDETLPLNYNVSYAFCDSDNTCDLDNNIFMSMIDETKSAIIDNQDITSYDLEFDKNYILYIYATYKLYDKDSDSIIDVTYPFYTDSEKAVVYLNALKMPTIVFSREAKYIDGNYVIDIRVNVDDPDRVLKNGKYKVELRDNLNIMTGDLQILDDDNNYITVATNGNYSDYEFDVEEVNKAIRIKGLSENTRYTANVIGNAYINNSKLDDKNVVIINTHTIYTTNASGVAFGNDVYYSATADSILVNFPGGSSFDNVVSVDYTVMDYDKNEIKDSGSYTIGENNKYFEIFSETDEWRFVIDPSGMNNELGHTYIVTTAYHVLNKETGLIEIFDSTYNRKFSGAVQYTKDNNSN